MAKATCWSNTDAEERKRGANGIRYPGSPRRKRCQLAVGGLSTFSGAANALS